MIRILSLAERQQFARPLYLALREADGVTLTEREYREAHLLLSEVWVRGMVVASSPDVSEAADVALTSLSSR